jgi:RNA polymerase sigma factor (sigma-70 family)
VTAQPSTTINIAVITAARDGDMQAIEQVLRESHPTITRFANLYCATPQDVEDAVQETLFIASQKIGTLKVASAFVSWLFRVVKHQCYRLLHHKRREDDLEVCHNLSDAETNPEYQALLSHDIVCALAMLPKLYRQTVIMRDVEGLSALEVAASLGVTVETVKSRLHRGRQILRHSLQHWQE